MNKLIVAFMLLFVAGVVIDGIVEGGGGISTTSLTATISDVDLAINVRSTRGFLQSDYIRIGDEKIRYTGITATAFNVPAGGRGYDGTTAATHNVNSKAYSPEASVINSALGFNIASSGSSVGVIDMLVMAKSFFFVTLPKLITWDFAFLRIGDGDDIIRIIFGAISVGFIVFMVIIFFQALGGVAQGIFRRP